MEEGVHWMVLSQCGPWVTCGQVGNSMPPGQWPKDVVMGGGLRCWDQAPNGRQWPPISANGAQRTIGRLVPGWDLRRVSRAQQMLRRYAADHRGLAGRAAPCYRILPLVKKAEEEDEGNREPEGEGSEEMRGKGDERVNQFENY